VWQGVAAAFDYQRKLFQPSVAMSASKLLQSLICSTPGEASKLFLRHQQGIETN
jgi:hypothetical protein